MIRLYDRELSGNCHKIRLMLSLLGVEYEKVTVDTPNREHKSPQFLKLNPLGQIPVLADEDIVIRDSQAILVYLARKYGTEEWLPLYPESMAKVMQWLSFAANEINNSVFIARLYFRFQMDVDWQAAQIRSKPILNIMNEHLQNRNWLELEHPTIADIACFPYIGLAPEGKIDLEPYPHVIAWIERITQLPGYVNMPGL
ncbi:MAG: glutathione S-transferase family protein [Richelia sp. RM2_1_2]|nr:glutathione S-transferase family protein [Richelia sp. SM2_1_7]NJM17730.1 glutathione S-transferase family protein [Richelia sp. SM1_7_0]NJN08227.1 glutathione S-transferase family protein [Richelia sp. RM1_1_1]NJO28055.1 glutathione S-transferase family protein [Richelia sp. SL_2_1]NJO61128.1 glutathione S-transferase family protein [Richelia sp. RM2_1_2]